MQVGAMQALVVVLNDQLPVGPDVVHDSLPDPKIPHTPGTKLVRQVTKLCGKRLRIGPQVDEDVAVPDLRVHSMERKLLLPEVRDFVHVRCSNEAAIE